MFFYVHRGLVIIQRIQNKIKRDVHLCKWVFTLTKHNIYLLGKADFFSKYFIQVFEFIEVRTYRTIQCL